MNAPLSPDDLARAYGVEATEEQSFNSCSSAGKLRALLILTIGAYALLGVVAFAVWLLFN